MCVMCHLLSLCISKTRQTHLLHIAIQRTSRYMIMPGPSCRAPRTRLLSFTTWHLHPYTYPLLLAEVLCPFFRLLLPLNLHIGYISPLSYFPPGPLAVFPTSSSSAAHLHGSPETVSSLLFFLLIFSGRLIPFVPHTCTTISCTGDFSFSLSSLFSFLSPLLTLFHRCTTPPPCHFQADFCPKPMHISSHMTTLVLSLFIFKEKYPHTHLK